MDAPQLTEIWLRVNGAEHAVHHATGIRVRDLPIRLDKLVERLS
jgi:hypothetical protein